MKKIMSLVTMIALLCTFSTTAFAASTESKIESVTDGSNSSSHDVSAKYNNSVATPDVYSVDVEWGAMEFTYNVAGTKDWNAADHSYTENFSARWTASGNTVTVTNHSNKEVTAAFGFAKDSGITEAITGRFGVTSKELAAGVVGEYATADKVTSTLTVDGALDAAKTALTKVGTVTVSIN